MKLSVAFTAEERERVEKVAKLVRCLFPIGRTHDPKMKDGYFHLYMQTSRH